MKKKKNDTISDKITINNSYEYRLSQNATKKKKKPKAESLCDFHYTISNTYKNIILQKKKT